MQNMRISELQTGPEHHSDPEFRQDYGIKEQVITY